MRWLIRLITPPGGIVLDCFGGSGSTAVAAIHENVHFILVEQSEEYVKIAEARIAHAMTYEPEVVKVATKKVKGNKGFQGYDGQHTINDYGKYEHRSATNPADQDGMEEVEDWDCHESCPIRILGEQSGVSKSQASGYNWQASNNNNPTHIAKNIKSGRHFEDTGTAARYFTQFPPDSLFADHPEIEETHRIYLAEEEEA